MERAGCATFHSPPAAGTRGKEPADGSLASFSRQTFTPAAHTCLFSARQASTSLLQLLDCLFSLLFLGLFFFLGPHMTVTSGRRSLFLRPAAGRANRSGAAAILFLHFIDAAANKGQ